MSITFFKKDPRLIKRFFNPTSSSSDADDSGLGSLKLFDDSKHALSYRSLRFIAPKESLEEIFERLMHHASQAEGNFREIYLQKVLVLLKNYPHFVNRVSAKCQSNPLELAIKLNETSLVIELLALKAHVRPENRSMLTHIQSLLKPTPITSHHSLSKR